MGKGVQGNGARAESFVKIQINEFPACAGQLVWCSQFRRFLAGQCEMGASHLHSASFVALLLLGEIRWCTDVRKAQ